MNNSLSQTPTGAAWYSRLTPDGPAAVSVWKIGGESAWLPLQTVFVDHQGRKLNNPPIPGGQCLGYLEGEHLTADEMLLVNRAVDGVSAFELHTHGGVLLADTQERILLESGFERYPGDPILAEWPKASRLVRHLYGAILESSTARGTKGFLHQSHILPQTFGELMQAFKEGQKEKIRNLVDGLLAQADLAIHWTQPFQVTLLGPPNVGKSSLMNALVGTQRAVVSETPGTTLDLVRAKIAIQGWPIDLVDTAGIRQEAGDLEAMGIRLARKTAENADLNLWLVEGDQDSTQIGTHKFRPQGDLVVFTKADLFSLATVDKGLADGVLVSAKTGLGIDLMQQAIIQRLTKGVDAISTPTACTKELVEAVVEIGDLAENGDFQEGLKKVEYWL